MGKIGFVSVGHADYLSETVSGAVAAALSCVKRAGHEVIAAGQPVTGHRMAEEAGKMITAGDADGVVIFLASWVECPVVMSVVRETQHIPLCLWGFGMLDAGGAPESTGSYVSFAMFKGTLDRVGLAYTPVLADPGGDGAQSRIGAFCAAAACAKRLRRSRVGLVGYSSMGIYPGTFDHVFMRYLVGPEIEQIDSYTLINLAEKTTLEQKDRIVDQYRSRAGICADVSAHSLAKSAGIYAAMETLVSQRDLCAINVKCQYEFSKEYGMVPCVPLSLLAETGVVASCEGDML